MEVRQCKACSAYALHLTRKKIGGGAGTKLTYECSSCGAKVTTVGTIGNIVFALIFAVGIAVLAFGIQGWSLTSAPTGVYVVLGAFLALAAWQAFSLVLLNKNHPKQ